MVKLNKGAEIGQIYLRRDGKKCVFVSEDKEEGMYRFRFRLLDEHTKVVKHVTFMSPLEFHLYSGPQVWDIFSDKEEDKIQEFIGDWYVRFNGHAVRGIDVSRDIIEIVK